MGMSYGEVAAVRFALHDNKRPRALYASSQYLDLFAEKAERLGVDRKAFAKNFTKVDGAQLRHLSAGFSREFIDYFNHRENVVLPEAAKKLEDMKHSVEELRQERQKLEELLLGDSLANESKILAEWYDTLHALGIKKIKKPIALDDHKPKYHLRFKNLSYF
ncbi:unnamed protein product [Gongylonema pulchrum]|uniref:GlnD_UR_UTase domain-containing protein n=1 Tax=Gongylonema pulchrum TaxID=637853 RepID=A0A183ERR1_9BILA|nr:unnamed protein product [Gongylonema pulchrum]